jgi:DivIVA domain-containing protein
MALTPEDVVNKRFQPTKFREGYDQDEVDDFLDEVVVELRRLNQENEELRQRLIASDSRINDLQRTAGQPAPAAFDQPVVASAPAPVPSAPAEPQAQATVSDPNIDPSNTNNLLQLARRLHEEHVREGVEKRDALIAEGQSQAQRVVEEANAQAGRAIEDANTQASHQLEEASTQASRQLDEASTQASRQLEEANAQAARLVEEAQSQRNEHLSALEQERTRLEDRIEELRNFEREYRSKLKGYIEGQLRELDSNAAVLTGAPAPAAVSAGASQGQSYTGEIAPAPATYPGFAGS